MAENSKNQFKQDMSKTTATPCKKTQNEIIWETEASLEKTRKKFEIKREELKDLFTKTDLRIQSFNKMNTFLTSQIILLYTNRTIWDQKKFWQGYVKKGGCSSELSKGFYDILMHNFFKSFNSLLYFEIENTINIYIEQEIIKKNLGKNLLKKPLFKKHEELLKFMKKFSDEVNNGLKILSYKRHSGHSGYIFNDEYTEKVKEIRFCEEKYIFEKGKPITVSYKFARDIIKKTFQLYENLANHYKNEAHIGKTF